MTPDGNAPAEIALPRGPFVCTLPRPPHVASDLDQVDDRLRRLMGGWPG